MGIGTSVFLLAVGEILAFAIEVESAGAFNINTIGIILMIAGIGILNLLLMAVYERTREIGLIGALGLKPRQISLLFILEGTLIGLVGVAVLIGAGFGAGLYVVNLYGFTAVFPWFAEVRDWVTFAAHVVFGVTAAVTYRALAAGGLKD